jgi:predicted transcriptional regulator
MTAMATVTYRIDDDLRAELGRFCEEHGLEYEAVVAEALASWLEDAEDRAQVEERRGGPRVEWAEIRKGL